MADSRSRTTRSLVVKGAGYVPPSSSTGAPPHRPPRGPFVMPSAPKKPTPQRIALAPSVPPPALPAARSALSAATRYGSMTSLNNQQSCQCQHPADVAFLQDVYVENMRMRIEMLELENGYLKNSTETTTEVAAEVTTSSSGKVRTPTTPTQRKRVEFADRIFRPPPPAAQPTSSTAKSGQRRPTEEVAGDQDLFNKLEEAYQKEFRLQERIKALNAENKKLLAARDDAEQRLRQLSSGERSFDKERHSLMTENIELQRRLDDLAPVVAGKDAEIEKLTIEKSELVSKIRRLSTSVAQSRENGGESRTTSAADLARKQELSSLRERFRALEMELHECRQKETLLIDETAALKRKLKEEQHLVKREQSMRENYADENAKLVKENSELTAKLSRSERTVERQERELRSQSESAADRAAISELRAAGTRLRDELNDVERRWKKEVERRETLEDQLRNQEFSEEEMQRSRRKVQEELQGLRALSDSLSAENQALREERVATSERMSRCYKKLNDKDEQFRQLCRRLEEFQRKYEEQLGRLRTEVDRQSENGIELDAIVRETAELATSRNAPNSADRSAESTARRETPRTPSRSQSGDVSEDGRPPLSPMSSPPKAPQRRTPNRSLPTASLSRFDSQSPAGDSSRHSRRKMS